FLSVPESESQLFARQLARLLHPITELRFVELAFVDIQVAHLRMLGLARRLRLQGSTAEEGDLDVLGEAMKAEKPAIFLDAIERRVPLDRLAHAGNRLFDQRIETAAHRTLPLRHGG